MILYSLQLQKDSYWQVVTTVVLALLAVLAMMYAETSSSPQTLFSIRLVTPCCPLVVVVQVLQSFFLKLPPSQATKLRATATIIATLFISGWCLSDWSLRHE